MSDATCPRTSAAKRPAFRSCNINIDFGEGVLKPGMTEAKEFAKGVAGTDAASAETGVVLMETVKPLSSINVLRAELVTLAIATGFVEAVKYENKPWLPTEVTIAPRDQSIPNKDPRATTAVCLAAEVGVILMILTSEWMRPENREISLDAGLRTSRLV